MKNNFENLACEQALMVCGTSKGLSKRSAGEWLGTRWRANLVGENESLHGHYCFLITAPPKVLTEDFDNS